MTTSPSSERPQPNRDLEEWTRHSWLREKSRLTWQRSHTAPTVECVPGTDTVPASHAMGAEAVAAVDGDDPTFTAVELDRVGRPREVWNSGTLVSEDPNRRVRERRHGGNVRRSRDEWSHDSSKGRQVCSVLVLYTSSEASMIVKSVTRLDGVKVWATTGGERSDDGCGQVRLAITRPEVKFQAVMSELGGYGRPLTHGGCLQ